MAMTVLQELEKKLNALKRDQLALLKKVTKSDAQADKAHKKIGSLEGKIGSLEAKISRSQQLIERLPTPASYDLERKLVWGQRRAAENRPTRHK